MLGMNFIPNYYAYFSFAWTFAIFVHFGFGKEQEKIQLPNNVPPKIKTIPK